MACDLDTLQLAHLLAIHRQCDITDEEVGLQVLLGRREMNAQGVLSWRYHIGGGGREVLQLQVIMVVVELSILEEQSPTAELAPTTGEDPFGTFFRDRDVCRDRVLDA